MAKIKTKELLEELEKTFQGIVDVQEGVEKLISGLDALKPQKGLGKDIFKLMNPDAKKLEKSWATILKKIQKQFGK